MPLDCNSSVNADWQNSCVLAIAVLGNFLTLVLTASAIVAAQVFP